MAEKEALKISTTEIILSWQELLESIISELWSLVKQLQ